MSDTQITIGRQKQLQYEAELETLKEQALEQLNQRKVLNNQYALAKTQELLQAYKVENAQEEAKKEAYLQANTFYVPKEPEYLLCVRIRGRCRIPPKIKKTLQLMRLHKPNHAVFVVNNQPMRKMIQLVNNYIAFGFADINLMRSLVYKRGFTKLNNVNYNITNEIIEDTFDGKIKCLEELIYQIYKGSPLAKKANAFLEPFALQPPRKGFGGRKVKGVVEGGATGNYFEKIGELVYRMLQ